MMYNLVKSGLHERCVPQVVGQHRVARQCATKLCVRLDETYILTRATPDSIPLLKGHDAYTCCRSMIGHCFKVTADYWSNWDHPLFHRHNRSHKLAWPSVSRECLRDRFLYRDTVLQREARANQPFDLLNFYMFIFQ